MRLSAAAWWAALVCVCVVLLVPLGLADVPPMLDYPNHLARAWLLAGGDADPVLAGIYHPHWSIIPNLATDLLWPPMMHVMPVYLAGRLVVGLLIVLPVLGTVAYHRAVFGVRSWWPLASGLVAYHASVLMGFVNFDLSLGLALLLAAFWIGWRDRLPAATILLTSLGAIVLFFSHLMGLIFFGVLIGSHEAVTAWRAPRRMAGRAIALAVVFTAPAILYLLSDLQGAEGPTGFLPLSGKALQLLVPFINYNYPLDLGSAALVLVFLAACLAGRVLAMTAESALAMLGIVALYAVAPFEFKGTVSLDTRFAVMLGFMLFAAFRPKPLPRWAAAPAFAVFALLFAGRMGVVAAAWHAHAADLAGLRRVTAGLHPGDRVYIASVTPDEAPAYWRNGPASRWMSNGGRLDYHTPALLLIEHHAFWPYLFADATQQPIELAPQWQALAEQASDLPAHDRIARCTQDGGPLSPGRIGFSGYNYVLLLEAGGEPDLAGFNPKRFDLVTTSDFAALYKIRTPIVPCTARISGN